MHALEELREMLMEELEKCSKKGELSAGSLDVIDKMTHAVKSIDTIMAMEDAGYSNESGYSYARGRGANARRDSMGRYSRTYGGREYSRDYSRDDAKHHLRAELEELKMDATDPETARMIGKWIKQIEE